jgi:FdrA protein
VNIKCSIKPNSYQDSVRLMRVSRELRKLPGVANASVMMATDANKRVMAIAGLLTEEAAGAGANDLAIVVQAEDGKVADHALQLAEGMLAENTRAQSAGQKAKSLELAKEEMPAANLAVISVPGAYAALEAGKALANGMHVMLFSDNVTVEEEIALKTTARENGLLLMGPDCGTAIINGVCLGFANVVNRGNIGIVGASGTGIQEVTCLLDKWGGGCSQVIGVGGRDVKEKVGGIMMLEVLQKLGADQDTQVIVVISKPPAASVMAKVLETVKQLGKPVVLNLLGGIPPQEATENVYFAATLEDAAARAISLIQGTDPRVREGGSKQKLLALAGENAGKFAPGQRHIRGLFSGGTLCFEAMLVLRELIGPVYSNVLLSTRYKLAESLASVKNTCTDLGEDEFTIGRPHPMIDMQLRCERILAEASDPSTAVILLDVVLGYGANIDPAGELAPVIVAAKSRALSAGRQIEFVAHVCGTDKDPQGLEGQVRKLRQEGVIVLPTNAQAAAMAAYLIGTT